MRGIVKVSLPIHESCVSRLEGIGENGVPDTSGTKVTDLPLADSRGLTFPETSLREIEWGNSVAQFGCRSGQTLTDLDGVFQPFVPNSHHPDGELRHILVRFCIILPPCRGKRWGSKEVPAKGLQLPIVIV
jgi:hypothetical protein